MVSKANEMPEVSDEVFAMVARELAGGKTDEGLWTKAFAMQNGNESATKAHYIRLRVEQIQRGTDGRIKAVAKSTADDSPQIAGPWARYFARYLDLVLGVCLALFLVMLLLATIQPANVKMPGPAWAWLVISLLVVCLIAFLPWVIDALMVAMFGNSLGKAIWGISVRHKDGRPLSFKETLNRNILVCLHGFWTGTTPLSFVPHIFNYNRLKRKEETKWDAKGNYAVLSNNPGALRKFIGVALLLVALLMLALMQFGAKMVANNAFKTESANPQQTSSPLSKKPRDLLSDDDVFGHQTSPPLSDKTSGSSGLDPSTAKPEFVATNKDASLVNGVIAECENSEGSNFLRGGRPEVVIYGAESGNIEHQSALARMYRDGDCVPKNSLEAVKWFTKAAASGHSDSQSSLGMMYLEGDGVPQNIALAIQWFQRAAAQGNHFAQHNLAEIYYRGKGVTQIKVVAYAWEVLASAETNQFLAPDVAKLMSEMNKSMTSTEIAEGQRLSAQWKPGQLILRQ